MSPRQREVLDGIVAGKPNKVIAQGLGLSARTVEAHRAAIMSKLGVSSLAALVRATAVAAQDAQGAADLMARIYPGLVSFWGNDLVARFANPLHERAFGKRPDDILGRTMREVVGAPAYDRSAPFIRGVLSGEIQSFSQLVALPGGGVATYCTVYAPHFDSAGQLEGFFAFMVEVSPHECLTDGFGKTPATVAHHAEMVVDRGSRILWVNDAFTRITRFKADEALGHTPVLIKPTGIETADFARLWEEMLSQPLWQGAVWYRRRDGYLFRCRQKVTAESTSGSRVTFKEIEIPKPAAPPLPDPDDAGGAWRALVDSNHRPTA